VPRPATLDDVAKLAGVSRSAVSRAFTSGASVSPKTRAKVKEAADALTYRPNLVARSLSKQRTTIVAIGITRLENSFYAEILQALSVGLSREGLRGLLFATEGPDDPDPPLDEVLRHQVNAVILLAVRLSSQFAANVRRQACPSFLSIAGIEDSSTSQDREHGLPRG
jgi:DNA-binding LacI/PurR family transcriptional regulator